MGHHKEGSLETDFDAEDFVKIHSGNNIACAHPKRGISSAERREGRARGVPKTCGKVYIEQVDLILNS